MHHGIFRNVRTYLVAAALLGAALALVSAIFFTLDNLPWTAFLTGILVEPVLLVDVPTQSGHLHASSRKFDKVLLQGSESKNVFYFKIMVFAIIAFGIHEKFSSFFKKPVS